MNDLTAFLCDRIFDGEAWHTDAALIVRGGHVDKLVAGSAIPVDARTVRLEGGMVAPGFVDLQVNGGGGVMLNDRQDIEAIRTICARACQIRHDGAARHPHHRHAGNHPPRDRSWR